MKNSLLLLTVCLFLLSCGDARKNERAYFLHGAWMLQHVELPMGRELNYTREGDGTLCHIYTSDSMLYECRLATTPTGLVIRPKAIAQVTLIDKGGGELLYLEDGDPHPLTICNDSTITIQRSGVIYTSVRDDDIFQEWSNDICNIIDAAIKDENADNSRYVLSAKERRQERTIVWIACVSLLIAVIALVSIRLAIINRRAKRQLQLQLRQIQEVQENRPSTVRKAVETVEKTFFVSDEYATFYRRITNGQRLKEEDWQQAEQLLKMVYPGFCSQLRGIYPMSELEFQSCLLIKLRIAPKDIATVLMRDISTISTVRSRLYKKVFGKKGGARDWDEFILSM